MTDETEADYLTRREEEELILAISAPSGAAREAHAALAAEYHAKLAALLELV